MQPGGADTKPPSDEVGEQKYEPEDPEDPEDPDEAAKMQSKKKTLTSRKRSDAASLRVAFGSTKPFFFLVWKVTFLLVPILVLRYYGKDRYVSGLPSDLQMAAWIHVTYEQRLGYLASRVIDYPTMIMLAYVLPFKILYQDVFDRAFVRHSIYITILAFVVDFGTAYHYYVLNDYITSNVPILGLVAGQLSSILRCTYRASCAESKVTDLVHTSMQNLPPSPEGMSSPIYWVRTLSLSSDEFVLGKQKSFLATLSPNSTLSLSLTRNSTPSPIATLTKDRNRCRSLEPSPTIIETTEATPQVFTFPSGGSESVACNHRHNQTRYSPGQDSPLASSRAFPQIDGPHRKSLVLSNNLATRPSALYLDSPSQPPRVMWEGTISPKIVYTWSSSLVAPKWLTFGMLLLSQLITMVFSYGYCLVLYPLYARSTASDQTLITACVIPVLSAVWKLTSLNILQELPGIDPHRYWLLEVIFHLLQAFFARLLVSDFGSWRKLLLIVAVQGSVELLVRYTRVHRERLKYCCKTLSFHEPPAWEDDKRVIVAGSVAAEILAEFLGIVWCAIVVAVGRFYFTDASTIETLWQTAATMAIQIVVEIAVDVISIHQEEKVGIDVVAALAEQGKSNTMSLLAFAGTFGVVGVMGFLYSAIGTSQI
jgi:hypothetical protein